MSVIFLQEDVKEILRDKYVVVMGGSIQRSIYKDMIRLLQGSVFLTDKQLRAKGETSCVNDKLVFKSEATNGIGYREVREYLTDSHFLQFVFMTRCFNAYVESMLNQFAQNDPKPDVVIINSCLWDLTRYGKDSVSTYKENLAKLFKKFSELLPDCFVIWITNPPIATDPKGGVFVPEVEHLKCQMELNVLEANYFARELAVEHGHDVLDMHYYLRYQIHRRAGDGIHWDMTGHRRMSNLILAHLAEAWEVNLPSHLKTHYQSVQESESTESDSQSDNVENESWEVKGEFDGNKEIVDNWSEDLFAIREPLKARNDNHGQKYRNEYGTQAPVPQPYFPPLPEPNPALIPAPVHSHPANYNRQMFTNEHYREYAPWSMEAQMQKWEQPEMRYKCASEWSGVGNNAFYGSYENNAYWQPVYPPFNREPRWQGDWHGSAPYSYANEYGHRFYHRYQPY